MPLMVYIGDKGTTRRSPTGQAYRTGTATNRGFDRKRIEALKRGEEWANRGSGATSWSGYQATGSSSASSWAANNAWDNDWHNKWGK